MKNTLIVCNTYYQLIISLHLAFTLKKDNRITIVVSDHSNNSFIYAQNLKKIKYINEVVHAQTKHIDKINSIKNKIYIFTHCLFSKNQLIKNLNPHGYDELIFNNDVSSVIILFRQLIKINPDMKVSRIEEGIMSYNNTIFNPNKSKYGLLRNICGFNEYTKYEKDIYCTYPELYKGKLRKIRIPLINLLNLDFINTINTVFNIKKENLNYPQKYIFFSSIHDFEGGEPVGELELVTKIAELVGKNNLLVKVHPRDNPERFIENNLSVDTNSSIPWEAIQLNYDFSNHVFITVCSGSVLAINSVIPNPPRTIFVYKLASISGNPDVIRSINYFNDFRKQINGSVNLDFIEIIDDLMQIKT